MTPTIAFFNNKGGVGQTTLVYHLAWMMREEKLRVLVADFDPQANLTAAFLIDDDIERLWAPPQPKTVFGCLQPLIQGTGDLAETEPEEICDGLYLLCGDLALSRFEDELAQQWPLCLDSKERAFRVTSALSRIAQRAARTVRADRILIDLGPSLGSITRAALIASDRIVIPLAADLFSLRALQNLGPTLGSWRQEWEQRLARRPADLELPNGEMRPLGYVLMQHAMRLDSPTKAYERWREKIDETFRSDILRETDLSAPPQIGVLKHYRSLAPMAQEARKPIFDLKPSDGAIGAHGYAVRQARTDFKTLLDEILRRV